VQGTNTTGTNSLIAEETQDARVQHPRRIAVVEDVALALGLEQLHRAAVAAGLEGSRRLVVPDAPVLE
jgi:hypothetical protein